MLLFKREFHEGLLSGAIALTFRAWDKPRVKAGGRYRCHPIGVLEVSSVAPVQAGSITAADAKRAGFASPAALLAYLSEFAKIEPGTVLWRVELHHAGEADRVETALQAELTPEEVEAIRARLEKFDRQSPWTAETLALIRKHPHVAASKLAARAGRETAPFKADVVKLKKLGLTQSFEVGYELSPRGEAFLRATGRRRKS